MVIAATGLASQLQEPHRAELGQVDGLDLHAEYFFDRTGGDFFDAVRVGSRVAFLLSDIAGRRQDTDPIAVAMQEVFRTQAAQWFGARDANLMEGAEMLVREINLALLAAAKGVRFAPTMLGCYDVQLGVLAYINAGGQTALIRDSEGTRALPTVSMPLGLFTHLPYDASMQAFEPGSTLLVVTKGVTTSKRGKTPFGSKRVLDVLQSAQEQSASSVCRDVLKAAHDFEQKRWAGLRLGRKAMREDMTALAMVRSAQPEASKRKPPVTE